MPVFFMISGYFFDRSLKKGTPRFVRERLKSVVWPYFLWTILHFLAQLTGSRLGLVNDAVEPGRILTILWDPISPFWFLYALAAALFVSCLIRSINPVSIALASAFLLFLQIQLDAPQIIGDVLYGLFYFSFGRVFTGSIFARLNVSIVLASFVLAVLIGFETGLPVRLNFVAGLTGIALFHGLCRDLPAQAKPSRMLGMLGVYSMGIFVMHITVLGAARAVGLRVFDGAILPTILFSVALAVLLPPLVQRLANTLGIATYLGLQLPSMHSAGRYGPAATNIPATPDRG